MINSGRSVGGEKERRRAEAAQLAVGQAAWVAGERARRRKKAPAGEGAGEEVWEAAMLVACAGNPAIGVIHGDIKPGNVLVGAVDGCVRICDLGLSKSAAAPPPQTPLVGTLCSPIEEHHRLIELWRYDGQLGLVGLVLLWPDLDKNIRRSSNAARRVRSSIEADGVAEEEELALSGSHLSSMRGRPQRLPSSRSSRCRLRIAWGPAFETPLPLPMPSSSPPVATARSTSRRPYLFRPQPPEPSLRRRARREKGEGRELKREGDGEMRKKRRLRMTVHRSE
uniref:Protein kinase domain-containing protein n=1 Tax=Oryza sativa subsp. japonica TaxID=39947 RepID=Q6ZLH3_ORYSJ|nr:hypothetical protein [Oryza sativa Japonica Group]